MVVGEFALSIKIKGTYADSLVSYYFAAYIIGLASVLHEHVSSVLLL